MVENGVDLITVPINFIQMKRYFIYILFLTILTYSQSYAQISLGADNVTNASVLLEINGINGGVILPWVDNANVVAPIAGSLIFDTVDSKIKLYNGSAWQDLTNSGLTNPTKLAEQNSHNEIGDGVIIGTDSDSEKGVLNLRSTNKGFVLPKVAQLSDIPNPESGTMVYVTSLRTVAIFNGNAWAVLKRL